MIKSGAERAAWEGFFRRQARNEEGFTQEKSKETSLVPDPLLVDYHPQNQAEIDRLEGMKNPLTKKCETCSPIHLPFDQFDLRHRSFYHSIVDPPG
jgi:hypothetical protein